MLVCSTYLCESKLNVRLLVVVNALPFYEGPVRAHYELEEAGKPFSA